MQMRLSRGGSDDHLVTAVFVAALLHGLLILGVRFAAPAASDRALPTLEVLLVPEGPAEAPNPTASYLAQRSQHGSGTSLDRQRTSLPEASASLMENPGEADGDSLDQQAANQTVGGASVLTSRSMKASRALAGEDTEQLSQSAATPLATQPRPQVGVNAVASDDTLRLRGKPGADDRLLADTRESLIAAYLDGWKRRIERVGTINFPDEARRRTLSGNPVLEVAIHADGNLAAVVVRRSSGHRELDNAAVNIVRLASPFDPFPTAMRERYPVLRFAYEWQFLNGRLGTGAVYSDGR